MTLKDLWGILLHGYSITIEDDCSWFFLVDAKDISEVTYNDIRPILDCEVISIEPTGLSLCIRLKH